MTEYISASLFGAKIAANLLTVLSGLGLLLAGIGLYSVMAYSVAQRTSEIGIRVTLGAQRSDIMQLVIGQGMRFVIGGLLVGTGLAIALGHVVSSVLVAVSPSDPLVFLLAAAFTIAITLAAAAIPARRALHVDPASAVRFE
jgi:ABC-type antimicrobial peptide transport system permease subunit